MRYEARMKLRRGVGRTYPAWFEWARVVPYRFRRFHCWWARAHRFFWLPCPTCGREFGGHEWRSVDGEPDAIRSGGSSRGICPACTRAGRGETR